MNTQQWRIPGHLAQHQVAQNQGYRSFDPPISVANFPEESKGLKDSPLSGQLSGGNSSKGGGLDSWFHGSRTVGQRFSKSTRHTLVQATLSIVTEVLTKCLIFQKAVCGIVKKKNSVV
jgi:hypothetical protein